VLLALVALTGGCETTPSDTGSQYQASNSEAASGSAEEFFIVDCLLPGQVRQLGGQFTYVTQRRAIKTAQSDCEIRGGEYVAYDRADYSTSLKIWLPLAQAGDATAQTYVGEIYEKGLGLRADHALAAQWYEKAVQQGHSRAQINLGNLYEKGLGVPQDKERALNLYRSASGLGQDRLLYASTLSSSYVPRQEYEGVQQELAASERRGQQIQRERDNAEREPVQLEQALQAAPAVSTASGSQEVLELLASVEQMEHYQSDLETQVTQLQRHNRELAESRRILSEQLAGTEKSRREHEQEISLLEQQLADSREAVNRSEKALALTSEQLAQQQREADVSPELINLQLELQDRSNDLNDEQVRLAQLQSEYEALKDQLAVSNVKATEYQSRIDQMQQQLTVERQEMAKAESEITALKSEVANERSRHSELTPTLDTLQRELAAKQQALEEQQRLYALVEGEKQSLAAEAQASTGLASSYEARIAELQGQVASAEQAQAESSQTVATLTAQLEQERSRGATLSPQLKELQDDVAEKNRILAEERVKLASLEARSQAEQQQLADTVAELERSSANIATADKRYAAETARLNDLLVQREQQLDDVQHELLLARAGLHMEQARNEQSRAEQAQAHQAELGARDTELQSLAAQLDEQYRLVQSQRQEISRLQSEASTYEAQLADTRSQQRQAPAPVQVAALDADGPSIEIIEPPVVLTRSQATVRVRTFQGERQVVGKIIAPSGLLSLSVNGKAPKLHDNNLFQASVPLSEDPTPVEVVLVDTDGRRAAVSFEFIDHESGAAGSQPIEAKASFGRVSGRQGAPMGNYHALIIGNNEYRNFSTLTTAVNDAREADRLLREKYGFKTRLLLNADRYTMLAALNELRENLDEEDNIYYAGHGKLDESQELGYWLPVDAEQGNNINWISNKAITDILNVIEAKHILVVADSCYAGTLTQTPIARVQADVPDDLRAKWIEVMAETRARITLTSGGVEPVMDGGGGRHSVFARAFLEALRNNNGVLEGYTLYSRVLELMASQPSALANAQVPQYAPIHLAGHESGEFFFNPT
jgi:hypothetical protein